jgi:hypothetical protein
LIDVYRQVQRELVREIQLVDMFQYPTIRTLAAHLERQPGPGVVRPATADQTSSRPRRSSMATQLAQRRGRRGAGEGGRP